MSERFLNALRDWLIALPRQNRGRGPNRGGLSAQARQGGRGRAAGSGCG